MIAITGATGHLGKLVIAELLSRGVTPQSIVAVVRDSTKATDLVSKGINVRMASYTSPADLERALAGVEKLLLISGNEIGQRTSQHTNVVNAAKKAKVKFIAYTSILKADRSKMLLAAEHLATEKVIQASGLHYAFLRNGWYIENYTEQLAPALQHGAILGSAKDGKVSAAARADYAAAAAKVLIQTPAQNAVYELGGSAYTMADLAKVVSQVSGKKIEYKDLPAPAYADMLKSFGLPSGLADALADSDVGISNGELLTESRDLESLVGRPLTTLETAVKKAVL